MLADVFGFIDRVSQQGRWLTTFLIKMFEWIGKVCMSIDMVWQPRSTGHIEIIIIFMCLGARSRQYC